MTYNLKNHLFYIIVLLFCFYGNSQVQQEQNEIFKKADSIISNEIIEYHDINRILSAYKRDTLKLTQLQGYFKNKGLLIGECYALIRLGTYARNTSQYTKAVEFNERALELAIAAENIEFQVVSLNMLGVVYRRIDAVTKALDYHLEALILAETVENPSNSLRRSIAVSLNSTGNIFLSLNQYKLAIQNFLTAVEIEKVLDNKLGLAINYNNIGYANELLGKLDQALDDYDTSLAYNIEIGSDLGVVICKNSIAQVYIKQERYKEAIEIISPLLKSASHLRDKFHLADLYVNLGWAYLELQDYPTAEAFLLDGLTISKKYNFKSSLVEIYEHLSFIAEKEKKFSIALEYYQKMQQYHNEVSNEKNFQYVNDLVMKYNTDKINTQLKILESENENVKLRFRKNQIYWFATSIILILLSGIFYVIYRQRKLKGEKRILALEQAMLRSQMNPHFIFNSLNSIKHYIIKNDQSNAVNYLNKFSKLIRTTLDASRIKEVSLADELETMQLYLNIENLRFSNEIDFKILNDDLKDLNEIKIPSLIFQPFIENSIWHGLSSKEGEKKIVIEVIGSSSNFVEIKILDNGIGRIKSAKIKAKKIVSSESVGIDITRKRLHNYFKDYSNNFSLSFKDLYTDNKANGTLVILRLPLT